jgi:hypothetical protein
MSTTIHRPVPVPQRAVGAMLLRRAVGAMLLRRAVGAMLFLTAALALPASPLGDGEPKVCPPAPSTLNAESLGQMLTNMGFEPEKSGEKRYRFTVSRDGYNLRVQVGLSPNDKLVWFTTRFGVFPEASRMVTVLDKLMEANDMNAPAYFSLTRGDKPEDRVLFLQRPIDNRDVTVVLMRETVDRFMALIVKSAPLWDSEKWPK